MKRRYLYGGVILLGVLFCLYYVHISTANVVYSDYIRLVNSYLPDVWDPGKFFVPDILTRIPINYLGRIFNVELFGYNMQVDRVMGVLGLGLSAVMLAWYSLRRQVGTGWYLLLMSVMFSLNKWEMITNGSGWAHFLAFAMFYYNFMVFDRVRHGEGKRHDFARLSLLPFLITLGVAGPYCAIYSMTLLLAYGFAMALDLLDKKPVDKRYLILIICVLIPLVLYFLSNSSLTEDYDKNSVSSELLPTLLGEPAYFVKFFLKSFGSMVLGRETAESIVQVYPQFNKVVCLMGLIVIGGYFLALWMNFRYRLYEKTIFPLMLLAAGGMNHVLILVSRWIFHQENYGMSSRYALQFQIGIFGIILTFALVWKRVNIRRRERGDRDRGDGGDSGYAGSDRAGSGSGKGSDGSDRRKGSSDGSGAAVGRSHRGSGRVAALAICAVLLAGNVVTTWDEWQKAPYRKALFLERAQQALHYEDIPLEELGKVFEYTRGNEKIKNALDILKENRLNVFYER